MKGEPGPMATLRPILDTYMGAAVAMVGCHAAGIQRESCEMDLAIVTNETRPYAAVKYGDTFFDLYFISEKEALRPSDPEVALSLAQCRPVRDSSLVLSTSLASNQAVMSESAKKCSRLRLTACLKSLVRADVALTSDRIRAANFWLLNASYDFAYSWLYGQEVIPSPSHLLGQLKEHSRGNPQHFEAFSKGAGLAKASRRECAVRLEGVSVLYDLLGARQAKEYEPKVSTSEVGFQIAKMKAEHLSGMMEHAEAYSFLAGRTADLLMAVSKTRQQGLGKAVYGARVADMLSDHKQGLLSDRLIRELGLERPKAEVRDAIQAVRGRVAKLARRV